MNFIRPFFYFLAFLLITSCASYRAQFSEDNKSTQQKNFSEVAHTFYLIGDAGNSELGKTSEGLSLLQKHLPNADENSTLIFLGDNVYEKGIPKKKSKDYSLAKHRIDVQIALAEKFKGRSIIIPGNHDWYSGLDGLKRQEKIVEKALGKNTFLPENGCPLRSIEISEDLILIIVDTHWYLTDWDEHPTINDDCEIKTRTKFLDEFEGLIKKNRGKTTLVALHHPMFTNGPHGGYYSFTSHMKPAPILGSLKNIIRKTSGLSNADIQNKKYNKLKRNLVTLAQENDKTIFVSGHEHSLQYIVKDNVPQIVSGSGSKTSATKLTGNAKFTYGAQGFAKLTVFKDGSSRVQFYSAKDDGIVYESEVHKANKKQLVKSYPEVKGKEQKASVYTKEEVDKSGFFKFIWGERYRKYFGTEVVAPIVKLDTLFGGLTPVRKGGGHQSKSLRMEDPQGREYVMRAIRKNALQYLQAVAFKDQYIEGQYDDTSIEALLMDVFTGSHPYAPFTIGTLADAVGIYHTNPVLYYIPKQNALGNFNEEFGDELYMIEERAASGHGDKASFGFSNKVISTDDMLKKISKDEDYYVDEEAYIKARLFDMLIGDFDRHEDQWRWAEFKKGKKRIYRPIPRDRDQAFSIMGDGLLLGFATDRVPALRGMRPYSEELKSTRWFNASPYPLDMALITQSSKEIWDQQVKFIQERITEEIIDKAFTHFPKEVQDETISTIKRKLLGRKKNLQSISDQYFGYINDFAIVKGTQKDDWFDIERMPNGQTKVTGYRIKKGKKDDIFHQKLYDKKYTKEIWIYGLDDDDTFEVKGKGDRYIKVRLIGGQNNDVYAINNPKAIRVYDYKSKKNTFTTKNVAKRLTDNYDINVYDYKKVRSKMSTVAPTLGFNPDDGVKLGFASNSIKNGFARNPFTAKTSLGANYFFATNGYELFYQGEFARVVNNWNLGVDAYYTSPNFAVNFFGYGNASRNPEANGNADMDFNRVKIRQLNLGTSLKWVGDLGAEFKVGVNYQDYKVENTAGRFVNSFFNPNNDIFEGQQFVNLEASYQFENADNPAFPTQGMRTDIRFGYTNNLSNQNAFAYFIPSISFDQKITSNGKWVFATKLHSRFTFGDGYEFYQAASIGGNRFGLRGFRNQRFTDKNSFYHSSDIRMNLKQFKTGLVPINLGLYTGFDYGRVWGRQNLTINPTLRYDNWHTSYGGGFFFTAANMIGANLAVFHSVDGMRIAGGFGFNF
ncbi:MAG: phosphoesterase [Flavobacteriaceae bacterium]|nr:phosphoesterase [Flavobacteriaceae bacterium]|tara:strand:+ start:49792 stop:53487 length:3696 start_codon:yes stop_codon:yes gene_type:complete